jgi:hypothetical protein
MKNIPRKNFKTIPIFQIAPTEHIADNIGQRTSFIRVTAGSITFDNPFGRDLSVQEEEEETSLLLLAVSQDIVEDDTEKRILPIG